MKKEEIYLLMEQQKTLVNMTSYYLESGNFDSYKETLEELIKLTNLIKEI